jgi:hypothetical protein
LTWFILVRHTSNCKIKKQHLTVTLDGVNTLLYYVRYLFLPLLLIMSSQNPNTVINAYFKSRLTKILCVGVGGDT